MNKRIAYLRDRTVNALWMLRNRKFRLMVQSIRIEIRYRIDSFNTWRNSRRDIPESEVPWSRYKNRSKVIPASYRPTVSRRMPAEPLRVDRDELINELQNSLDTVKLPSEVDE